MKHLYRILKGSLTLSFSASLAIGLLVLLVHHPWVFGVLSFISFSYLAGFILEI
jgi:hypothetical protein